MPEQKRHIDDCESETADVGLGVASLKSDNPSSEIVLLLSPSGMSGSNYLRNLIVEAGFCDLPANRLLKEEDWFIHWTDHLENYVDGLGDSWAKLGSDALAEDIEATKAEILLRFGEALARIATKGNHKRTILKTPSTKNLQNIRTMFPEAKVIFLIRDGRDACASRLAARFDDDMEESFRFWATRVRHMMRFAGHVSPGSQKDQLLWVRFEDAVNDPDSQMERLAEFLGLEFDASTNFCATELPVYGSSEFGQNADGTFTKKTVNRPAGFNPIGRWRAWPNSTRKLFHEIAGVELVQLGYEPNHAWCSQPDEP